MGMVLQKIPTGRAVSPTHHAAQTEGAVMAATKEWKLGRNCQCGRGCTREQRLDAERRGRELAALLGDGWTPRVWDNLGWHVAADAPHGGYLSADDGLTVYAPDGHGRDGYSVMGDKSVLADGRTPIAAVRRAHAELDRRRQVLDTLSVPLFAAMRKARAR